MAVLEPAPIGALPLASAPSLIERLWPAQKISAEAEKERRANLGQTLTALGSYWKGRKPLVLARACILGALLPATDDPERDIAIFEKLMAFDDDAFAHRAKRSADFPAILEKAYVERIRDCLRPEELEDNAYAGIWEEVNAHLGTNAGSFQDLVGQLGRLRFGHHPTIGDAFCGGGSIPFEAARLGCDALASDLNPVATMLTWGAAHVVGAPAERLPEIKAQLEAAIAAADREIVELGIEHDEHGNRAKAFLYCAETRCPHTGWMIPMAPSWVVSKPNRVVVKLIPDPANKRFTFEVKTGASDDEMDRAAKGTVQGSNLVSEVEGEVYLTPIATIRGDRQAGSRLRSWTLADVAPEADDVLQERLYCIHWIRQGTEDLSRTETFYCAPTEADLEREHRVLAIVRERLAQWQAKGLVPDAEIVPGDLTGELGRARGWTHWHHVFNPRQLLLHAVLRKSKAPIVQLASTNALNWNSKLCTWNAFWDKSEMTFYNPVMNTLFNYGARALPMLKESLCKRLGTSPISGRLFLSNRPAASGDEVADVWITDPPYADAVNYHEISEYFIAWLRKNHPAEFDDWIWDSRRALAVRGSGEDFRAGMIAAYQDLARRMPPNGIQIVMFTHQSARVWADMAEIVWAAGLRVMAAWQVVTETTSGLKQGGYVRGTVMLVLRRRESEESGYRDEVVQEIRAEVGRQIGTMVGLNQSLKGKGRIENLFGDADLQMAGYAAALRILTAYTRIDGVDMTQEALRPRRDGEPSSAISGIIEFAVQVANEYLVPEPLDLSVWERLAGTERFYLKMMELEAKGPPELEEFQSFAKAFRVPDHSGLVAAAGRRRVRLKLAREFKKADVDGFTLAMTATRAILFAMHELQQETDGELVIAHLRDLFPTYRTRRDDLAAIAAYIASKREGVDAGEAEAARVLLALIRNERVG